MKITFCPHFLLNLSPDSAAECEKRIDDFVTFCEESASLGLKISTSKQIISAIMECFPWHELESEQKKDFVLDWQVAILPLINRLEQIDTKEISEDSESCCGLLVSNINARMDEFLNIFGEAKMPDNTFMEGVISEDCGQNYARKGFYSVNQIEDFKFITHPWLRIYHPDLPHIGMYRFQPPHDWQRSPIASRGPSHGYLDNRGIEWTPDRFHHNGHWDVQEPQGHVNVSFDGRIL